MDLDLKETALREVLQETIQAAGERPSTDKIPELFAQVCSIATRKRHSDVIALLVKALATCYTSPNTGNRIFKTIREISMPQIVNQPNPIGAAPNLTDNDTGVALTFKVGLYTGILIGTIFGGFILKCLSFVLIVGGMTVMYLIIGSMHKSQGSRLLLM